MTKLLIVTLIAALLAVICSTALAQTNTSLVFNAPWDPVLFKSPAALEDALKKKLTACPADARARYVRVLGGGPDVLTPRLFINTISTADNFIAKCIIAVVQPEFPTLSSTPSNDTANCFSEIKGGFQSGIAGCPSVYGAQCSDTTVCTAGTLCSAGTCAIVPNVTAFDFQMRKAVGVEETTPGEALRGNAFVKKVKDHVTAALGSSSCVDKFRAFTLISAPNQGGAIVTDTIRLLLASDVEPPQDCSTALKTIPALPEDGTTTDTDIISGTAIPASSVGTLDRACYSTTAAGFINAFSVGGSCPLSRPLGHECTGAGNENGQVCPDPNATCDVITLPGTSSVTQLCTLHNSASYFTQSHVHILHYETAFLGTAPTTFSKHFATQAVTDACKIDKIIVSSHSLSAVNGSITKFNVYFIASAITLSVDCQGALTTLDLTTNPAIKSVSYEALDTTSSFPPFSCFATDKSNPTPPATPVYLLVSVKPGGRCPWKLALDMTCKSNLDCDLTSQTKCQYNPKKPTTTVCTRPDLIPDPTDIKLARIDLEATAYLGSHYGEQRLNHYLTKLNEICPFTAHLFNIGNTNFSKVQLWVTPFDYTACPQSQVQLALNRANLLPVSKESVSDGPSTLAVGGLFTSLNNNDLDFDPLAEKEGGGHEGGGEKEPVDPSSIIPKFKWGSVKVFTKTLPLKCLPNGATVLTCSGEDPLCDIPCSFGSTCGLDSHCGASVSKCTSGHCAQRGLPYLERLSANGPLSFAAFLSVISMVIIATMA